MNQDQKANALNFIVSLSHLFNTTYKSKHNATEGVHIVDYRDSLYPTEDVEVAYTIIDSPISIFRKVTDSSARHIVNVFHDIGTAQAMRDIYETDGYRYQYTAPLQRIELPAPLETTLTVEEALDADDVNWTNESLKDSQRTMPIEGIGDPMIRRFYATMDDKAIGWAQLVNAVMPGTAYIGEMYTLPDYRNQGVASALLNRIHEEAYVTDCNHVLLVPSREAVQFYNQFGYKTVAEFSVFKK
jgi:GNAT superfamily N-acetyltransferase